MRSRSKYCIIHDQLVRKDYFGIQIEPFNMKKDRDKGNIHEDGYIEFTRKNDPDELKYREIFFE